MSVGSDLDEIEIPLLGEAKRIGRLQDTDLLALVIDEAHLGHTNPLVDPGRVPLWRAPVKPAGDRH
jgi:hypothetical protein